MRVFPEYMLEARPCFYNAIGYPGLLHAEPAAHHRLCGIGHALSFSPYALEHPAPPAATQAQPPVAPPEPKEGHFDGWSFFGGILLTLGMAAIGFVGVKYYKLRSGAGGNYNRF